MSAGGPRARKAPHGHGGSQAVRDWWKRPFDLAILVAVHVALAPLWIALWTFIPLAIWLHDRGPVFYTQPRLGKGGRVFRVYKFRSMVPDAERMSGAVWASENDPRITPVGRVLRSRALDELPQVINMFKGDLSLVGPRAERPELAAEIAAKRVPDFERRLLVRPGLTGLAPGLRRLRYGSLQQAPLRHLVHAAHVSLAGLEAARYVGVGDPAGKVAGQGALMGPNRS